VPEPEDLEGEPKLPPDEPLLGLEDGLTLLEGCVLREGVAFLDGCW